jgi:hypothetical protein
MMRRWHRWLGGLTIVALSVALAIGLRGIREPILRAAGRSLVVEAPVEPVDVIVVFSWAASAGVLEAADLVHGGIARRVAVYVNPPDPVAREFARRGIPYEDRVSRLISQLKALGVVDVERIPSAGGTQEETRALLEWCDRHQYRSVVVVSMRDHSRRLHRILRRSMQGHRANIIVHPTKYSEFDPDRWWETHDGLRTGLIEMQKLLFDILRHPISLEWGDRGAGGYVADADHRAPPRPLSRTSS